MVWEKILRLANGYLPQWRIPQESPDIGEVIARIFAEMMESYGEKNKDLPDRARRELLSLLGIRPFPAKPARTILVAETYDANGGVRIPKGSPFLYDRSDRDNPVVFSTEQEIMAVSAKLTDILFIAERSKHICTVGIPDKYVCLKLFSAQGPNLYQEELVLEHSRILKKPFRIASIDLGKENLRCVGTTLRAGGAGIPPELLYDGERELNIEEAAIFGEEVRDYKECWIGNEEVFSKAGAEVIVSFELQMKVFKQGEYPEEEKEWKLVQRKQKKEKRRLPDIWAEEIAFSYYTRLGWKKLVLQKDQTGLFAQNRRGRCELRFRCPDDWEPVIAGGNELKCLRIQIVKAPFCYEAAGTYHYPVLKKIQLAYSYGESGVPPKRTIFPREFPYTGESMLFGFDRTFPEGKVSLLFLAAGHTGQAAEGEKYIYEYSTEDGFCTAFVEDKTDGLMHSGLVYLEIAKKPAKLDVEGRERFWIRLRRERMGDVRKPVPELAGILLNGVEACNSVWSDEKEYYLEEITPFPEFSIAGEYLLDVEVKVREENGYVLWNEVEDFEKEGCAQRGYVLDRRAGVVKFGDGRRFRVPECTDAAAALIRVCTCEGEFANLPGGTEFVPGYPARSLGRIYQPFSSYDGKNPESEEQMWKRGSTAVNTGRQLISAMDWQSRIREYADEIAGTAFITEADGKDTLVVLMKDFRENPFSFYQMKGRLEALWRDRRGAAFQGRTMRIREPAVIRVSVEVWLTKQCGDRFVYEEEIKNRLAAFFAPECGWEIGKPVLRKDLERVLEKTKAPVKYFNAVFEQQNPDGTETWNLDEERIDPASVCIGGKHKVHWMQSP